MEETIHVRFNDNKPDIAMSQLDESFAEMRIENIIKFASASNQDELASNTSVDDQPKEARVLTRCLLRKHYPESHIIGDPMDKVQIRNSLNHRVLLSEIEPEHIDDVMFDEYWVKAMQKELVQFQKN